MNPNVFIVVLGILVLLGELWLFWSSRQKPAIIVPAGAKTGDLTLQSCIYKAKSVTCQADWTAWHV